VARDGSIDWLCWPRFDSAACFAALLGKPEHGRWRIAPQGRISSVRRAYRKETLILETELETAEGAVRLIDFMPVRGSASDLVRRGLRVVAARYYRGRRPPSTGLFISTDTKLGDESELFADDPE